MANTTNFNWETPDDTDLVKDGAAAIRTLGSAIDTSLVDLKGGTTGQILSKATNTDMDFTWITNDVGDITAVTAGTGISGGGTSGAVTITNSMATEIAAKGDLIVGTGSATFDNLTVGTNGHVLTADSTTATGLKWAAAASGSTFVGAKAYLTSDLSISNVTLTTINWGSESFDTDSIHSTSTNTSRFTVPSGKGGKWAMVVTCSYSTENSSNQRSIRINKNGTYADRTVYQAVVGPAVLQYVGVFDLVAADYLEVVFYQESGSTLTAASGDSASSATFYYLGA